MSLITCSSASPDCWTGRQVVALLGVELGVEQQLGHADDAVHRRADLVAHVGEELALDAIGLLGFQLGAGERGIQRGELLVLLLHLTGESFLALAKRLLRAVPLGKMRGFRMPVRQTVGHVIERRRHRHGLRAADDRYATGPVAGSNLAGGGRHVAQRLAERDAPGDREQKRQRANPGEMEGDLVDGVLRRLPVLEQHERCR